MKLKIEAARRQLGTALALFIENKDPVSVHCLANGGCELIEHEAELAGEKPFFSHMLNENPQYDTAGLRRLQREFWNAFKHATERSKKGSATRNDDEALCRFNDLQNDTALFIGWTDFANATGHMPVEAQVFQAWYIALNRS